MASLFRRLRRCFTSCFGSGCEEVSPIRSKGRSKYKYKEDIYPGISKTEYWDPVFIYYWEDPSSQNRKIIEKNFNNYKRNPSAKRYIYYRISKTEIDITPRVSKKPNLKQPLTYNNSLPTILEEDEYVSEGKTTETKTLEQNLEEEDGWESEQGEEEEETTSVSGYSGRQSRPLAMGRLDAKTCWRRQVVTYGKRRALTRLISSKMYSFPPRRRGMMWRRQMAELGQ